MGHAIVFPSENKVEVQEYRPPALRDGELLVRTEYSGISQGTEIWALIGQRPELKFPTIPGYQSVGVIEQVGPGVTGYAVGQRVLWHRSRLPDTWPDTWMAAHVSHATVPVDGAPPPRAVPEGVDPVAAALSPMAAVSLRGVEMLKIGIDDLIVVMGQGLIGQTAAQWARLRGATVLATDLSDRRLELSRKNSADIVINPTRTDLPQQVRALRPAGADVVIDTTGRSEAFAECIDLLRVQGQFLMQGYYPRPVTFDFHATHLKRPTIAISCGIGDTDRVLDMLRYGRLNLRPLVTHLVGLEQAPDLYARMAASDPEIMGAVFNWTGA